jgi:hypothetical protein
MIVEAGTIPKARSDVSEIGGAFLRRRRALFIHKMGVSSAACASYALS